MVGHLNSEIEQNQDEPGKPSSRFDILSEAVSTLTDEVKNFSQKNPKNTNTGSSNNQRFQRNNHNYNKNQRFDNRNQRFNRLYRNDHSLSVANGGQRSAGQFRGSNSDETNQNATAISRPKMLSVLKIRGVHDETQLIQAITVTVFHLPGLKMLLRET